MGRESDAYEIESEEVFASIPAPEAHRALIALEALMAQSRSETLLEILEEACCDIAERTDDEDLRQAA